MQLCTLFYICWDTTVTLFALNFVTDLIAHQTLLSTSDLMTSLATHQLPWKLCSNFHLSLPATGPLHFQRFALMPMLTMRSVHTLNKLSTIHVFEFHQ
mmetsp:Transcript_61125/g.180798  ORF Transcript_61125/g.180798 Transcript_61125/m.180798 type:complete len:98 (+) Transcript_61125:141-434(+)